MKHVIHLGPAGSPVANTLKGLAEVKKLGLQAMEVEFTHGIKMGMALARQIGEENKKYGIDLSIHAPYFINLASEDRSKVEASKRRILESCKRGAAMGAKNIVFHAAYYGKRSQEETHRLVIEAIKEMQQTIRKQHWNVVLAPETTGKLSAHGNLDEILDIVKHTKCGACIDPAHLYARAQGKLEWKEIFDKIKFLKQPVHFHFSGITWTSAGERSHVNLDSKPNFKEFAKEIMKRRISCTIISESPITWKDSLKMKEIFENLGYRFE
jgi:deoxyribonuclease-4